MSGSSRRIIPREELSEFQRWQFSSLLGQAPTPVPEPAPAPDPEVPEHIELDTYNAAALEEEVAALAEEQLPYPTAEEIEAIERQAQEEGYQAGLAQGRLEAAGEVAAVRGLLDGLSDSARDAEAVLAMEVLDLALVIARQLVRQEVAADRTLVLNVIREALAGLPAAKAPARIVLNPADLLAVSPLLSAELSPDIWRLVADNTLESGACRIETPNSSVDLTLENRWQSVLRVLGRDAAPALSWGHTAQVEFVDDDPAT